MNTIQNVQLLEARPFYNIGPNVITKDFSMVDFGQYPITTLNNIMISIQNNVIRSDTLSQIDFAGFIVSIIIKNIGSGGGVGSVGTGAGDKFFLYTQNDSSAQWTITHGLGKFPSVTVVDSANNTVIGDVQYLNANQVQLSFGAPFGGYAYLN